MTKFIDFNNLSAGTVVDNEYSSQGVTISAFGGSNKAMIFDTDHPTGGDHDLETSNLGGALIISEDGDSHDPDDNAGGGTFKFNFDAPADVNRLTFLDIEEGAVVKFFAPNGSLIKTVSIDPTDNNGQSIEDFDVSNVGRMEVTLNGSGAIDNLVFDDTGLDGIVEGDNTANLIDAAYDEDPEGDCIDANDQILPGEGRDDDIVDALGGDDTVKAGEADDDVYAGSGNDSVEGGNGDDLIFGDSNYAGPNAGTTVRESFEWELSGVSNGSNLGGFTQDTGNVDVTFSVTNQSGAARTILSNDTQNVQNIDADGNPVDADSSLDNILNGNGNSADYKLDFSDPVEDVSFRVNDIDGDGVVRIKAYDASGAAIVVNLEAGSNLTLKDTDGVAGNDTADSNGGYEPDTSEEYSLLVSIPGPVARIVIEHDQNGSDNSGINITDVYFDAPVIDDGAAGNDTLEGGDGNDTIFGEDGDDLLRGGNDDDSLVGGDGADRLEGGAGNDTLDGGADRDILLGGSGDDVALGGDGNDEIWMGSGNDSAEGGADNDWMHGQSGNDTLDGQDGNDMVFGENGDDVLSGGAGNDTLSGGADADTIFGGAGDEVDGGSGGFNNNPALNTDLDVLDLTGQGPFYLDNVTPDSNGNGINGTVVFLDGAGNPNGLTLSFTEIEEVIGEEINRGPEANDDDAEVDEDGSVDIPVLANDTDPDGDTLRVTTATSPDGDVTINADGSLTFEPDANFNGPTTITYTITDDNGGTDTGTVNVTVNPVNDDPVANDDIGTTPFNTPVTIDVLDNDTDVDGDTLRVTQATSPNGVVVIDGDGNLLFTPEDGFEGNAVINYTVTDDNGGFDTAQVTVTVEPNPLDGIVTDGDDGMLIDTDFDGDLEGDKVDNNDEILPGEGPNDDIIMANGGNDTVLAGEGDDDVFAGTGDDEVDGGSGDDILRGEEGNDLINGGAGDDTIDGGDDDDTINGGDGSDSILGGDGNDSITSSDPGNDLRIDKGYPGLFSGEEGTPEAENERDFVDGGAGNDTISTGDDRDTIVGGTGDDVIDGGIDDDEITGDDGADRIVGGEGEDTILGGVGDDTIYAGNDPVLGLDALNIEDDGSNPFGPDLRPDNGRDLVDGGEGNDLIFGADDDDTLIGGSGNDTIDGEIDDDSIDGGTGDDSLLGGQGNDTIDGGTGNDFINAGRNADVVDGGDGNDTILGENGADVLNGGDGDDVIDGGTGDDTLNGDGGDDLIIGSTGDDVIDGGAGNDTIDGGNGGADEMRGGDDRDTFINVDAGETVDGDEGGDDFDTLDLRGSAPGGGSLEVIYEDGNPENGVVNYFDTNGDAAGSLTFSNIENVIPCFTPGTLIATPTGERRVEDLSVGDRVITRDNGIQEIRWVGQRAMSGEELAHAEHLHPVLIRKGALGAGLPERDMLVSPQHRILMASDKTSLYFDESEVLVAAKHLTAMDGIDVVEVSETTYIHVMFDQHEVILSDGAWTESFQPGDQTLASMGDAQRAEILELFPEFGTVVGVEAYTAARRSLKKHEARLLAQ